MVVVSNHPSTFLLNLLFCLSKEKKNTKILSVLSLLLSRIFRGIDYMFALGEVNSYCINDESSEEKERIRKTDVITLKCVLTQDF
jgi:hypothetical protein